MLHFSEFAIVFYAAVFIIATAGVVRLAGVSRTTCKDRSNAWGCLLLGFAAILFAAPIAPRFSSGVTTKIGYIGSGWTGDANKATTFWIGNYRFTEFPTRYETEPFVISSAEAIQLPRALWEGGEYKIKYHSRDWDHEVLDFEVVEGDPFRAATETLVGFRWSPKRTLPYATFLILIFGGIAFCGGCLLLELATRHHVSLIRDSLASKQAHFSNL